MVRACLTGQGAHVTGGRVGGILLCERGGPAKSPRKIMRTERVNVFYYPDMMADIATIKKAILFFDEIHFMDRPAFTFAGGAFGLIGCASPLRRVEQSFREEGVPFFVHNAPIGPVEGEFLNQIRSDIDDLQFLKRFQEGLKTSSTFRQLQIPPGNYGEWGNEENIYQLISHVDLAAALTTHDTPSDLFFDRSIRSFDLSTTMGRAKNLVQTAIACSAKMNFALNSAAKGFVPLADATPYGDLLSVKYARAISKLAPIKNKMHVADLSFAIFNDLIPRERIDHLSLQDIVRYRKESEKAREAFLEYLVALQAKHSDVGIESDYAASIEKQVATEIVPAAQKFRNDLTTIADSMFGALAKGVVGFVGSASIVQLLSDLSLEKILLFATAAASYMAKVGIDGIIADRRARRECSVSYILSLEK